MIDSLLTQNDALTDFEHRRITLLGKTKLVYVSGSGPAVIVMTEIPGITPHTARFARWVREAGFTVYMPHFFGIDGEPMKMPGALGTFVKACVSAEFRAFAANASSPITRWLRALAAEAHQQCGGKGVGAIGMCFTGNFGLSMMLDKSVIAPVMTQPSLPLHKQDALHLAPNEVALIRQRLKDEDLSILAYRFAGDKSCQAARFAAHEAAFGERFIGRVLPDSAANPDAPVKMPHSVVTMHLIDEAGQPTVKARDEILAFFKMRLSATQ